MHWSDIKFTVRLAAAYFAFYRSVRTWRTIRNRPHKSSELIKFLPLCVRVRCSLRVLRAPLTSPHGEHNLEQQQQHVEHCGAFSAAAASPSPAEAHTATPARECSLLSARVLKRIIQSNIAYCAYRAHELTVVVWHLYERMHINICAIRIQRVHILEMTCICILQVALSYYSIKQFYGFHIIIHSICILSRTYFFFSTSRRRKDTNL